MAASFAAEQCFVLEEYPYPVAAWATARTEKGGLNASAQQSVAEEIRARQLAFLNRIPGEYEDSDGDTAVDFLLVEVPGRPGKQASRHHSQASLQEREEGKRDVDIWLDSDDDSVEISALHESAFGGMTTTRAKRSAAAVAEGSSTRQGGSEAAQQTSRRVKKVERISEGVSPVRRSPRVQSAGVQDPKGMGGREDVLHALDEDCYAVGGRSRRSPTAASARPRFPSKHGLGLRSGSHNVIDLDAEEPSGFKTGESDFAKEVEILGYRASGRPRLQKLRDANHQPSLLSGSSRELLGTSSAAFGKRSANCSADTSDGRAGAGAAAAPDTFGAAKQAAGAGPDAGHHAFLGAEGHHAFFGAEALEGEAMGEPFFCLLCQNTVPRDLTLEMPACSCRFCSFCLEPAIHTQLEAMALQVESGMLRGEATDQGTAAGGSSGGISLSPLQLSGGPRGGKEGSVKCPGCSAQAPTSTVKALAPVAYRALEGALKSAELIASQPLLACPSCGLRTLREASELPLGTVSCGVPEIDRTAPCLNDTDEAGRPLSLAALQHRETHRFRCPQCTTVFCGGCARMPYHAGRTCVEQAVWESRPSCRFCAERVEAPSALGTGPGPKGGRGQLSLRELRRRVAALGADEWWCVEKRDLQAVLEWASEVCQSPECQEKLKTACTRTHSLCGHPCGGVRKEVPCLPCLHEDCVERSTQKEVEKRNAAARARAAGPSGGGASSSSAAAQPLSAIKLPCADDFCPICWVDPLGSAPSLLLSCGHVVHAACALEKVHQGYPGPEISFAYLRCPVCPELMDHVALIRDMYKPLLLKAKVDQLLEKRVEAEVGVQRAKPAKSPGRGRAGKAVAAGAGAGVDVAETRANLARRCLFFECARCKQPYFGGDRRCGEAGGGAGPGAGAGGAGAAAGAGAGAGAGPEGGAGGGGGAEGQAMGRGQARNAAAEEVREKQKQELVCGDCVAAEMAKKAREAGARAGASGLAGVCLKDHGTGYVQYKCRYCCSPATFFCFGTTHFCSVCHTGRPDCRRDPKLAPCRGGKDCPLGVPEHPPAPSEYCLGCALCRVEAEEAT